MLWILLVPRVLRYSITMVSEINPASTGSVSSTEGPNTASADNMISCIQNPEHTSSTRRTNIRKTYFAVTRVSRVYRTRKYGEYSQYTPETNTTNASILHVLQLPPAKVLCSISHSRDHPSVNECFHRFSQYLGVSVFRSSRLLYYSLLCLLNTAVFQVFQGSLLRVLPSTGSISSGWYCEYW